MEEQISSIVEALKINAEKTPDKLCVGDKKNQVTYKEFWNMVKKGGSLSSGKRRTKRRYGCYSRSTES